MNARILYRDGSGRDAFVDVSPDGVFLGSSVDRSAHPRYAGVARTNFKISFGDGRWMVEDLGSSTGTFVNEVRIQKCALNHADVVRCGTLQVRFVEIANRAARC